MRNLRLFVSAAALAAVVVAVFVNFMPTASSQKLERRPMTLEKPKAGNSHENFDIRSRQGATKTEEVTVKAKAPTVDAKAERVTQNLREVARSIEAQNPNVKVQFNEDRGIPEIVEYQGKGAIASPVAGAEAKQGNEITLRRFVSDHSQLFGVNTTEVDGLVTVADYTNPAGNLAFVELEQRVNDIPVFQGYIRGIFAADGRLVRTTGLLAPSPSSKLASTPKLSPSEAVAAAALTIGVKADGLPVVEQNATGRTQIVEKGPFDENTKVEQVYFPIAAGRLVLAYSMVLWQENDSYYILVDAGTGALLWRKNITQDQTQSVTYNVYNDDSPQPQSPGTCSTPPCPLPTGISRTDVTNISENAAFDNLGWIPDGAGNAVTTGNNVDAGLDLSAPNGIDTAGRATGTGRVFNFPYIADGATDPTGSNSPADANYRMGAVTNIFFWTNRYHDLMYNYGFTEQARNFQNDNFGRGGLAVDFVQAEAQDSSGTNNANFSTPGDGTKPRMQMFIFTTAPNRDGDLDQEVSIHEMTHGLSNRLHANAAGLGSQESGGMGEGWSDYYARALLSSAAEDVNGLYASGAYVTKNYYYGIRRFPYAVRSNIGPNGKPHNPTTFADIDPTQINLSDGAFAPAFVGAADEVHNIGDIWANMLLEMRAKLITTLGYATGNPKSLQIVTDGMKLDPVNPSILDARNSIIAANCSGYAGANELDIWQAFATHGAGFRANYTVGADGLVHPNESFDNANLGLGNVVVTEVGGSSNGNGIFEPGETVSIQVPLVNGLCATTANTASATLSPGGLLNYGNIAPGTNGTQTVNFVIPNSTACGTAIPVGIAVNSTNLGPINYSYNLPVGSYGTLAAYENFDGVTAPGLPAGWTTTHSGAGLGWATSATNPDTSPNTLSTGDQTTEGLNSVTSPPIAITTGLAQLSFRNLYNLEGGFDAESLQIKIGNGAFQDIIAAGGAFTSGGYNSNIGWTGLSGGTAAVPTYITTTVRLPGTTSGQLVQFRWTVHSDANTIAAGAAGASIDSIQVASTGGACATFGAATVNVSGRVTTDGTTGISGILVNLSGTTSTATFTDATGAFAFNGLVSGGNYVVTPATAGYDYTPANRTFNNVTANITNADFTAAVSPRISGRVTTPNGAVGIDGVTVTLSGTSAGVQVTSGGGFYSFNPLTGGGNYTVTPSGAGNTYSPASQNVNNLSGLATVNFTGVLDPNAVQPAAVPAQKGQVLITEFRQSVGATTSSNEYVELYNNTDAPISVAGYGLAVFNSAFGGDVTLGFPAGVTIPRRGHIIVANTATGGYSLTAYASATLTHPNANLMPDNQGFALIDASRSVLIDSVGFVGNGGARPYLEGQGLRTTTGARPNVEHAWVRKIDPVTSLPVDTDNNLADFQLVSVTAALFAGGTPTQSILGAPGPENAASPTQGYTVVPGTIDPGCVGGIGTMASACTYARDLADTNATTSLNGTMHIRKKITNNTGAPLTSLRFRIIDDTTLQSPGSGPGQADLRLLSSTAFTANLSGGGTVPVEGLTLDAVPAQALGGGINSTVAAGTITVGSALANGASVNVDFKFGVQQIGGFRLIFVIEGSPTGGATFTQANLVSAVVTASGVSVGGRVRTADGRGVTNANVVLTNSAGVSRTIITGRNGVYRFDDVAAGETYVVSVASRRFIYSPRIISVTDNLSDIDFTPDGGSR